MAKPCPNPECHGTLRLTRIEATERLYTCSLCGLANSEPRGTTSSKPKQISDTSILAVLEQILETLVEIRDILERGQKGDPQ